jgi:hypothetical protein
MPRKRAITASDVIAIADKALAKPSTVDELVDNLDKHESSKVDRKIALRAISSYILRKILHRVELDGDTGGLLPMDMALRYMRFIMELDSQDMTNYNDVDPVELLSKLTGLPRDVIVSMYYSSSQDKFKEVTLRKRTVDAEIKISNNSDREDDQDVEDVDLDIE